MDLVRVTNEINAELNQIHSKHERLLGNAQMANTFNSIVTLIMDNLADVIELSVRNRRNPQQVFVAWEYDLSDSQYPRRLGPDLQAVLQVLSRVPQSAYFSVMPKWSKHFLGMDASSKEYALRGTIWDKAGETLGQPVSSSETRREDLETSLPPGEGDSGRAEETGQPYDLATLEFELLKLAAETRLVSTREAKAIMESVRDSLNDGYINGVQVLLFGRDRDQPILEWNYQRIQGRELQRSGGSVEQAMAFAKEMGGRLQLEVRPILSQHFRQLTSKEQIKAMRRTIWAPALRKWYSRK